MTAPRNAGHEVINPSCSESIHTPANLLICFLKERKIENQEKAHAEIRRTKGPWSCEAGYQPTALSWLGQNVEKISSYRVMPNAPPGGSPDIHKPTVRSNLPCRSWVQPSWVLTKWDVQGGILLTYLNIFNSLLLTQRPLAGHSFSDIHYKELFLPVRLKKNGVTHCKLHHLVF